MPKTLYVSDLDGTLLSPEGVIDPETARMVNEAIRRGALFTVATARTPATLCEILEPLDLNVESVVITGGALYDWRTGRYSDVQYFSPESAAAIAREYERLGFGSFLFCMNDNILDVHYIGPLTPQARQFVEERLTSPYKRFHIHEDGRYELPSHLGKAILFFAIQPNAPAAPAYDAIKDIPGINPLMYHDIYGPEISIVEIFPDTTSKALAVGRLAAKLGADRVVAFGDNINDLPMLRAADLGVAVGNALPAVKEAAGLVIGPNTDHSVPRFILSDLDKA